MSKNKSRTVRSFAVVPQKNSVLQNAKRAKKDEFYTQLVDIENELRHYKAHLKGKIVYCNCDDPCESKFVEFFVRNFNTFGLKELIATSFTGSPVSGTQLSLFDTETTGQISAGEAHVLRIKRVKTGDLDDVGSFKELLEKRLRKAKKLTGDGDFRSPECVALLQEADIVVTNPPFSLFREYVAQLIEYRKKFLIIGHQNAFTYKEIFPLIKLNKLWIGYHNFDNSRFQMSSDYDVTQSKYAFEKDGLKYGRVSGIRWFTNLDHSKRHDLLQLYKNYTATDYLKYDNYDAIEVSKTAEIPCDYYGMMGVPITFLDKYNPEQFEILGITQRDNVFGLRTKKYTAEDSPKYNDLNARSVIKIGDTYVQQYARIIIKRKDIKQ